MSIKQQFIGSLKFLAKLTEATAKVSNSWLEGVGLAGRSLEGANFSSYSQSLQSLKGTDFNGCNLQHSNFMGVIGGFSFVRPIILLIVISFSLAVTIEISPNLDKIFQPLRATVSHPQGFGFIFMLALSMLFFLKMSLAILYGGIKLPPQIVQANDADGDKWVGINHGSKVILVSLPVLLGFGTYYSILFVQSSVAVSLTAAVILIGLTVLFGIGAISTFIWVVGDSFMFRTSFIKADLDSAQLTEAQFPGCNFCKANLRAANLQKGNFKKCNFKQADLRFVDFRGADLRGANLKNARINGAIGLEEALKQPTHNI